MRILALFGKSNNDELEASNCSRRDSGQGEDHFKPVPLLSLMQCENGVLSKKIEKNPRMKKKLKKKFIFF